MSPQFYRKLETLEGLAKPFRVSDTFLLFNDHDGWTDGYLADLTNLCVEEMTAKATLQHRRCALARFKTDKAACPNVAEYIPSGKQLVEDLELDLADGMVWLKTPTIQAKVNPVFIKYFAAAYKSTGGIVKLVLSGGLSAVKVIGRDNKLIGLIMPLRS